MLDALRFVASAVAKKDYIASLTHFKIKDGRVLGFNGNLALNSDINVDLDVCPNAVKFMAAIRACESTIALNMTPAGKLAVKSGTFKSFVDCLTDDMFDDFQPQGVEVELGPNFLDGLKALQPAMGIDASRPWAMGIKLQKQSMYATNNVMLAEYWHGSDIPLDTVIPANAVNELLRIDENPTKVQVSENTISFWFGEKRWLRTTVVEPGPWPTDRLDALLGNAGDQVEFSEGFFDAIAKLKPFLNEQGSIYLGSDCAMTSQHEGEGTIIEVPATGMPALQAYNHNQLTLLGQIAQTIDWSTYPKPCPFAGNRLRGVIVGQRL